MPEATGFAAGEVDRPRLKQLKLEADIMFDGIQHDDTKPIMFGFIATLALADLAGSPVSETKRLQSQVLRAWTAERLDKLVSIARSVAAGRFSAQRVFNGGVWLIVANGIEAKSIDPDSAEAKTILAGIDRFIAIFVEAPAQKLSDLGIDRAIAMVEPRQIVGQKNRPPAPTRKNDDLGLADERRLGLTPADRIRSLLPALAAFIGLIALTWVGMLFWVELSGARARNEAFNPAVTQAFRSIEAQCKSENAVTETVRCKHALETFEGCNRSTDSCLSEKVYCVLDVLQFNLPTYYRPGTPYGHESPC